VPSYPHSALVETTQGLARSAKMVSRRIVRSPTGALILLVALAATPCEGRYEQGVELQEIRPHDGSASRVGVGNFESSIESDALSDLQMRELHRRVDTNSDGKASMGEFLNYAEEMKHSIALKDTRMLLDELDLNLDGELDWSEYKQDMAKWSDHGQFEDEATLKKAMKLEEAKFKAADLDHDNALDVTELPAFFYPELHSDVLEVVVHGVMAKKDRDGDHLLDPEEFFAEGSEDTENLGITEQELKDFRSLDTDGNGKLDVEELTQWESGFYQLRSAMRSLFQVADTDLNEHLTSQEMKDASKKISSTEAQYHLMEWAEHHEEL